MESLSLRPRARNPRVAPPTPTRILRLQQLPPHVAVGPLRLNCRTFDLTVETRTVSLTPAEFELLYYLMSRAGQVFSAADLLCEVWGYLPGAGRPELIRAHVKNLRIKIEPNPREPAYLRTVGHQGYVIGDTVSPNL